MIYSISGLLRQVAPTYCVVEACGVGYQCSASTHTLSSLPGRGQEVTLLTHLWVKEDGMELFGFSTEQERRCFRMLIGVSGVGPRVALAILSDSAPDRLMQVTKGMTITVRYFKEDTAHPEIPAVGNYVTLTGKADRIDPVFRTLQVGDTVVPFEDLVEVSGEGIMEIDQYLGISEE